MIQFIENSYGTKDTTYILYLHRFMKTTGAESHKIISNQGSNLIEFDGCKISRSKLAKKGK